MVLRYRELPRLTISQLHGLEFSGSQSEVQILKLIPYIHFKLSKKNTSSLGRNEFFSKAVAHLVEAKLSAVASAQHYPRSSCAKGSPRLFFCKFAMPSSYFIHIQIHLTNVVRLSLEKRSSGNSNLPFRLSATTCTVLPISSDLSRPHSENLSPWCPILYPMINRRNTGSYCH